MLNNRPAEREEYGTCLLLVLIDSIFACKLGTAIINYKLQ